MHPDKPEEKREGVLFLDPPESNGCGSHRFFERAGGAKCELVSDI
jgi:hypothetical protein